MNPELLSEIREAKKRFYDNPTQRTLLKCLELIETYRIESYYDENGKIILDCLKNSMIQEPEDKTDLFGFNLNLFKNTDNLSDEILDELEVLDEQINEEIRHIESQFIDSFIEEHPYGLVYNY